MLCQFPPPPPLCQFPPPPPLCQCLSPPSAWPPGFIDVIVCPTFDLLGDMLTALLCRDAEAATTTTTLERVWDERLLANRGRWEAKTQQNQGEPVTCRCRLGGVARVWLLP